jgi:plasmid stability protein
MKTTIELPDDLFRRLKIKAAEEGRSMKDFLTGILSEALSKKTGGRKKIKPLPIIRG